MSISKDLILASSLAKRFSIDKPYMVGGVPRDYAMSSGPIKTSDIDLTTNTPDSLRLGILLADKLNCSFKIFDDNHITLYLDKYSIDFSSNFKSENVIKSLNDQGIDDPKLYEVYSRDFSINTLHQDLLTKEIIDPTGSALDDISERVIRTPLDPSITIGDDPRRIFRGIYFASKYGFDIDKSIIDFVKNNTDYAYSDSVSDRFVSLKINKSMLIDSDLTIKYLRDMNILSRIPLSGYFKDYLIKNKLVIEYLDNTRHDFLNKKSMLEQWSVKSTGVKLSIPSKYATSCSPVHPVGSRNIDGQNIEKQLEYFMDAIISQESGGNYSVRPNRSSGKGRIAVGAYQILIRNWYGIADANKYYFDKDIVKENGYFCNEDSDLVSGEKIHSSLCRSCKTNECYRLVKKGEYAPDEYAWNYQAGLGRDASFMINKENEDIYLSCTKEQFEDKTCGAQASKENQDTVAKYMMGKYFEQYYCDSGSGAHLDADGSNKHVWGAVAASWYAGERNGGNKPLSERSDREIYYYTKDGRRLGPFPSIKSYSESVMRKYHRMWSSNENDNIRAPSLDEGSNDGDISIDDENECMKMVGDEVVFVKCSKINDRAEKVSSLFKASRRVDRRSHNPDKVSLYSGSTSSGLSPRVVSYVSEGGAPEPISISGSGEPSRETTGLDLNYLRYAALYYGYTTWGSDDYSVTVGELDPDKADIKIVFKSDSADWNNKTSFYEETMTVYYAYHGRGSSSKWRRYSEKKLRSQKIYNEIYDEQITLGKSQPAAMAFAQAAVDTEARRLASKALSGIQSRISRAQGSSSELESEPYRYEL